MKQGRKRNRILSKVLCVRYERLLVTVSLVFLNLVFLFTASFHASKQLQRKTVYGTHNGVITNITEEDYEKVNGHVLMNHTGLVAHIGEIVIEKEDGLESLGEIGGCDTSLFTWESFQWLEGHAPQNEGEIVLETTTLNQLGLTYQCPMEITLKILEEGKETPTEKTYTLVGIVKPFSANWSLKNVTVPCVFTYMDESFTFSYTTDCYLDSSHENEEEMNELKDLLTYKSERLIYNDYTYPAAETDTTGKYEYVSISYCFLVLFLFAYLLLVWKDQQRYRKRITSFRNLGCKKKAIVNAVLKKVVRDWYYGFLVATFITLSVYCVGYFVFSESASYAVSLSVVPLVLSAVVLGIMTVVHLGMLLPLFSEREYNVNKVKKHKPIQDMLTYKALCKIENQSQSGHIVFTYGLLLGSVICMSICSYSAYSSYHDYSIRKELNYSYSFETTTGGLTLKQIHSVEDTHGIEEVIACNLLSTDVYRTITFSDNSGENKEYFALTTGSGSHNSMEGMLVSFPKDGALYNTYIQGQDFEESFNKGETVLLYMPSIAESNLENQAYQLVNMLETGDLKSDSIYNFQSDSDITLHYNEQDYTFNHVQVISKLTGTSQRREDLFLLGSVIVSPSLYKEITGSREETYNTVYAYEDLQTADDTTAVILSNISEKPQIEFTDASYDIENMYNDFIVTFITLCGILLFIFVFSVSVFIQIMNNYHHKNQKEILLLKELGATDKQVKQLFSYPSVVHVIVALCFSHFLVLLLMGTFSSPMYFSSDTMLNLLSTLQFNYVAFPWIIDILGIVLYSMLICCALRMRNSL